MNVEYNEDSETPIKFKRNEDCGVGTIEIMDINIDKISGVLVQNNSVGKFVQVYDHDGKSLFRFDLPEKELVKQREVTAN